MGIGHRAAERHLDGEAPSLCTALASQTCDKGTKYGPSAISQRYAGSWSSDVDPDWPTGSHKREDITPIQLCDCRSLSG